MLCKLINNNSGGYSDSIPTDFTAIFYLEFSYDIQ
jgi:hypothetical protein